MVSASYTTNIIGAITALYGYFQNVQANPPNTIITPVGFCLGTPTGANPFKENMLMIGSWRDEGGTLISDYSSDWFDLPAAAGRRYEPFAINWSIMTWQGDINPNPLELVQNAFALFDAVIEQMMDDYPWNSLGASGAWGQVDLSLPIASPMQAGGFGVVLECKSHVVNAIAQGY